MNTALFVIVMQTLVPGALVLGEGVNDISGDLSYWTPNTELTPELALEAYRTQQFKPATGQVPNLGFINGATWFAMDIRAPSHDREYIANIGYAILDSVQFWVVNSNGLEQFQHAGDLRPFHDRAIAHRTINFSVNLKANQKSTLLFKVDSNTSVSLALKLYPPKEFTEFVATENIIQGIYFGIILVMIIFNGFLFFSLRDKNYLLYVGFLFGYMIFQASINGYLYQYVFSFSPWLSEKLLLAGALFASSVMFFFAISFLEISEKNPKTTHAGLWTARVCLLFTGLAFVLPYTPMSKTTVIATIFSSIFCIVIAIVRLKQGYRPARIFLLAWGAFLGGAVLFALRTAGMVPSNLITEYGVQIGSALEAVLLTLALCDRMNLVQQERDAANSAAIQSYRLLGEEVDKRDELERNNRALGLEMQLATEQLVQADKLATLGQLVAGVAHDIANPTSYIRTSQEIVRDELRKVEHVIDLIFGDTDSEEARKVRAKLDSHLISMQKGLSDIKTGSERITEIHEAIRNQSRIDNGPMAGVEIKPVVNEAITMVRTKLHAIKIDIRDNQTPSVTCRRSQIGQVLMNLISNAADAINEARQELQDKGERPAPGIIQITLLPVEQKNIAGIAIRIEDNGPGIPEEKRSKVRETFFTTKAVGVGTGLGLSICEKIVALHGGKLLIDDSIEFGGASMTVWLPVQSLETIEEIQEDVPESPALNLR